VIDGQIRTTTKVCVRGLSLLADIGVNAGEIGRLQPLMISVQLELADEIVELLDQTIDYRLIVRAAEMLAQTHTALIETFARKLCPVCIGWNGVAAVGVSIDKPLALASGLAAVEVTAVRGEKVLDEAACA
jgi:dihydroneopterin aldolase